MRVAGPGPPPAPAPAPATGPALVPWLLAGGVRHSVTGGWRAAQCGVRPWPWPCGVAAWRAGHTSAAAVRAGCGVF
jgi:hypothetical protein